jgi:glycosyltransferase involved in cell wall biosynthesis
VKQIKLCIVVDEYPACNGAFFQSLLLARELRKIGGKVIFVSYLPVSQTRPLCAFESKKIDVGDLKTYTLDQNVPPGWRAIYFYLYLFFRLRNRYNQVLIQGLPAGIFWMFPVWKLLGKKVFIRLTGLNVNDISTIRRSPWGFIKNLALQLADRHINPSLAMENNYRQACLLPAKSVKIPNGIDTERFHPLPEKKEAELKKELGYSPQDRIVLYVGTIRREKGIDLLLEAWDSVLREVPQALLVIIGPLCPVCSKLKAGDRDFIELIRPKIGFFVHGKDVHLLQNKKDRIQFLGVVDRVERFYQVAELFAFPSRREGMPNVVMEAMASGVPVVANDIEEVTGELIQNEREGVIVPGENTQAFAGAIIGLLNQPETRQQISQTARKKMEEQFSPSKFIERYDELFSPRSQ